jgi:predicted AAA+ superfamily ATPase
MKTIFYRTIELKLKKWKEDNDKKPLLVVGPRQIGKSFVIKEFIKKNYKNFVEINFWEKK